MVYLLGCFAVLAAVIAICLFCKVRILKLSLREISVQAAEKFEAASNVPLTPQSRDKDVQRLASKLTGEIDAVIADKRRYAAGNGELFRAVTNVSHDLRTPLTSASGYLGLLRGCGLNEKQAEYAEIIEGRLNAMKSLTEELLSYSVVVSDEESAERSQECVNDLLEDSLTQFYIAFAERGIEPQIRICEGRVFRMIERGALSRIFGNIISNAVRYSDGDFCVQLFEDGTVTFENAASRLDEVSAGKLFDRFFTVENARGSTGLGLSIAKHLVEKNGGAIGAGWADGRLKITIKL